VDDLIPVPNWQVEVVFYEEPMECLKRVCERNKKDFSLYRYVYLDSQEYKLVRLKSAAGFKDAKAVKVLAEREEFKRFIKKDTEIHQIKLRNKVVVVVPVTLYKVSPSIISFMEFHGYCGKKKSILEPNRFGYHSYFFYQDIIDTIRYMAERDSPQKESMDKVAANIYFTSWAYRLVKGNKDFEQQLKDEKRLLDEKNNQ